MLTKAAPGNCRVVPAEVDVDALTRSACPILIIFAGEIQRRKDGSRTYIFEHFCGAIRKLRGPNHFVVISMPANALSWKHPLMVEVMNDPGR